MLPVSLFSNTIINLRHRANDNQNYNNIIEKLKLSKKSAMLDVTLRILILNFIFQKKNMKSNFEAILVEPHKKVSKLKEKFVVADKVIVL